MDKVEKGFKEDKSEKSVKLDKNEKKAEKADEDCKDAEAEVKAELGLLEELKKDFDGLRSIKSMSDLMNVLSKHSFVKFKVSGKEFTDEHNVWFVFTLVVFGLMVWKFISDLSSLGSINYDKEVSANYTSIS